MPSREIDAELSRQHARPDFERAREAIIWLSERWLDLTVAEKAEALRILVDRVTYAPNDTVNPEGVRIRTYGRAFIEPSVRSPHKESRLQRPKWRK